MSFSRFWMDYINTWPTALAILPLVALASGWCGLALARRILRGEPSDAIEWLLLIGICAYLARRAAYW